MRIKERD